MNAVQIVLGLLVLVAIVFVATRIWRKPARSEPRRMFRGPGAGASGAMYELLNEDKRKAIEIIVQDRAAYKDPETADDKPKPGSR